MKKYFTIGLLVISLTTLAQQKTTGKYVTVEGRKLYYEESGKGTPLLLLHGGFGTTKDFEKVTPILASSFRVIAIDNAGHGRSEYPDTLTYPRLAQYISGLIDALKLDSAYVMGWSDGGVVALQLAIDRPDKVKKVLSAGANVNTAGMAEGVVDFIQSQLRAEAVEAGNTWLSEWRKQYESLAPKKELWRKYVNDARVMWLTKVYIPMEKIKTIQAKVIVLMGDKDLMTLEHGVEIYRTLPRGQFCVLPNTGHTVFAERPDEVSLIAKNFFLK